MTTTPLKDMDPAMLVFELSGQIQHTTTDAREREQIMAAAMIATHLHRKQTRMVRNNLPRVPYIEHPLRVTLRLLRWGVRDTSTIISALLHDTVEDCAEEMMSYYAQLNPTGMSDEGIRRHALRWIVQRFGTEVAFSVHQVSNPLEKSVGYLDHLRQITGLSALLIKASDLVDNAGSLPHQHGQVPEKFITKRLDKYVQAVGIIRDKLLEHAAADIAAGLAAERLAVVSQQLHELQTLINE